MGGDSKQINKQDNFIVAKYSEDNKQDDVKNRRSANLNRMSEETVTLSQPHEVIGKRISSGETNKSNSSRNNVHNNNQQ